MLSWHLIKKAYQLSFGRSTTQHCGEGNEHEWINMFVLGFLKITNMCVDGFNKKLFKFFSECKNSCIGYKLVLASALMFIYYVKAELKGRLHKIRWISAVEKNKWLVWFGSAQCRIKIILGPLMILYKAPLIFCLTLSVPPSRHTMNSILPRPPSTSCFNHKLC